MRHFPSAGLVVDLGCGVGALSLALADLTGGRSVLAVDHDQGRLDVLARRAVGSPLIPMHASIDSFAIPDCQAIALVDVLHYFDGDKQDALLASAVAAITPGGVLVLRDPDASLGLRFVWNRLYERVATGLGFTHAHIGRYRSADGWRAALEAHGLAVEVEPVRVGLFADRVVVGRRP